MTTPRRPFNRAAFLAGYRAACEAQAVNPATGNPAAWDDPHWWENPALWTESGRNHSSTEAAALANVAAQARRARGVERPKSNIEIFGDVFLEGAADRHAATAARRAEIEARRARRDLPLRERYAAEGKTVEEVAGKRILVNVRENVA